MLRARRRDKEAWVGSLAVSASASAARVGMVGCCVSSRSGSEGSSGSGSGGAVEGFALSMRGSATSKPLRSRFLASWAAMRRWSQLSSQGCFSR
jgi:hypothetical protein